MVNTATLKQGECVKEAPETQFSLAVLVDCDGDWDIQILNTFEVTEDGPFPGHAYIDSEAFDKCDIESNFIFPPTVESWPGGRVVICAFIS